jgi:hypothetical protein
MMIDASFVEEIIKNSQPWIQDYDGRRYVVSKNGAYEILPDKIDPTIRYAPTLNLTSLTGLVDYCQSNNDGASKENSFIRIDSSESVSLHRDVDVNGTRHCAASAKTVARDKCSAFYDYDDFVSYVLKWFRVNDNTAKLLDVASRVKDENSAETDDNGISQTIVLKIGTATASKEKLQNPTYLAPNTLFPEIASIPQPHIFRIQNAEKGERFTLKCVASSDWSAIVAEAYAGYLKKELPDWRILR